MREIDPNSVLLLALSEQVAQAETWLGAAKATLRAINGKRAPIKEVNPSDHGAPEAVSKTSASETRPALKKAEIMELGKSAGIPQDVLEHEDLLRSKHRPSAANLQRAVTLIEFVKGAQEEGDDPSDLWEQYLPED